MATSREWHLVRRPEGRPVPEDVALREVKVGAPGKGEVVVQNLVMSVEPYMRGRMDEGPSYAEPYALHAPMHGRAVGRVTASEVDDLPEGALVLHECGWRELARLAASDCTLLTETELDPSVHLGALGITGMTAWVGLERVAHVQEGDAVFVTSAAGGVGSMVVQLATARGCTVVGSAGGPDKVAEVKRLGARTAFDHRAGRARDLLDYSLEEAGASGIDVVFDNVGGDQLEAAIRRLNDHARIALCGMISVYNADTPQPGPRNLLRLIWTRSRMEGFLLADHEHARADFEAAVVPLLLDGSVENLETRVGDGIEDAFDAFLTMLDGGALGKVVVPLA